ncbi:glycosyltransferase family A protein [Halorussus caseinilyticus]|uniref:Glycosyltransferase family A protein n=1 Tax=Halorussus caseinilyticus TaxID=3034025 RepID=A0ABD5WRJ8_9EURY
MVRSATEAFDSELVVVDSNSSDRTVERATDHPASVLRIPTDDLSTPAAGRYVGGAFAAGEQVLFVDSDVVVADGWLEAASRRLAADPDSRASAGTSARPVRPANRRPTANRSGAGVGASSTESRTRSSGRRRRRACSSPTSDTSATRWFRVAGSRSDWRRWSRRRSSRRGLRPRLSASSRWRGRRVSLAPTTSSRSGSCCRPRS